MNAILFQGNGTPVTETNVTSPVWHRDVGLSVASSWTHADAMHYDKENLAVLGGVSPIKVVTPFKLVATRNSRCPCGSGKKFKNCCIE